MNGYRLVVGEDSQLNCTRGVSIRPRIIALGCTCQSGEGPVRVLSRALCWLTTRLASSVATSGWTSPLGSNKVGTTQCSKYEGYLCGGLSLVNPISCLCGDWGLEVRLTEREESVVCADRDRCLSNRQLLAWNLLALLN